MKRKRFNQYKKWLTKNKNALVAVTVTVVLVVVGGSFLVAQQVDNTIERTNPSGSGKKSQPELSFEPSPLTGLDVSPSLAKRVTTAVIVENSPEARPQSGLVDAGVVYEAIAEGGITRFLAFFQEAQPQVIGPVRSVRPYFVDWFHQYDAPIAHVGGSTDALASIRNRGLKDLDQFFNAGTYWRDTARFAPHNTYTSTQNLDRLIQQKGYTTNKYDPLPRKNDAPKETPTNTKITVNISSFLYNPVFTYNKAKNNYSRSVGGAPHKNREDGRQISPKVVVVLQTPHTVYDSVGHLRIQTTGKGTAWVFQDGGVTKGQWNRPDLTSQIVLRDANDKKISLNKGQTWFSVLPTGNTVNY